MSEDQNPVNPYQAPQSEIESSNANNYAESVLADRGPRLGAALLDSLFIIIALIPVFFIYDSNDDTAITIAVSITVVAMITLLAFNLNYLYKNGQTIGKRIVGVKIVRTDDERCGLARIIFLRNFVIGLLGNIPLIGPFVSLADPLFIFRGDRRCIHDLIADTKVIIAE